MMDSVDATLDNPRAAEGTSYPVLRERQVDPFKLVGIEFPRWESGPALDFGEMARRLKRFTRWSDRALAEAIGTSHPTVAALLKGSPTAGSRNRHLLERLRDMHGVVSRIFLVASKDPRATVMALTSGNGGRCALEYLAQGEPEKAYLAALDALRPRPTDDYLVGTSPSEPGRGTAAYLDED